MANDVSCMIQFYTDKDAERFKKEFCNKDEDLDFNKVVPIPDVIKLLTDKSVGTHDETIKTILKYPKDAPIPNELMGFVDLIEIQDKLKELLDKDECGGCTDWYEWNCQHWGTKWNAYEGYWDDEETYRFSTAWSAPIPVLEALAEKGIGFSFYAEEGGMGWKVEGETDNDGYFSYEESDLEYDDEEDE